MYKKIKGWLTLLSIKGIGKNSAVKIAQKLGEPYRFLYEEPELSKTLSIFSQDAIDDAIDYDYEKIFESIEKNSIKFVSILDAEYPALLKEIYDPPPFLFYKGNLGKNIFQRAIAIVGTRKPTSYGRLMTNKIASVLADFKFTIVSGLAYGIDTIAHETALKSNTYTVAVLGTPLDNIYPPGNRKLAEKILENGVIFSEYIPTIKTEKWSFPERNRIISGLSSGVVVIEGSKKSGSLITAKLALEQNREIFALPGDIGKEQSEGPNFLIKQGANIITNPKDIPEAFQLLSFEKLIMPEPLTEKEEKIYNLIKMNGSYITFDEILIKSGFSYPELSAVVLSLELKNMVKKASGNKYLANI